LALLADKDALFAFQEDRCSDRLDLRCMLIFFLNVFRETVRGDGPNLILRFCSPSFFITTHIAKKLLYAGITAKAPLAEQEKRKGEEGTFHTSCYRAIEFHDSHKGLETVSTFLVTAI